MRTGLLADEVADEVAGELPGGAPELPAWFTAWPAAWLTAGGAPEPSAEPEADAAVDAVPGARFPRRHQDARSVSGRAWATIGCRSVRAEHSANTHTQPPNQRARTIAPRARKKQAQQPPLIETWSCRRLSPAYVKHSFLVGAFRRGHLSRATEGSGVSATSQTRPWRRFVGCRSNG